MADKPRDRGPSIVGPFILIGLGCVLLMQQLNIIQWSLWEIAFRLWPLIVIAVGADILIARRSFLGAVASLALVLALLAGGIYLMGPGPSRTGEKLNSDEVSYALEDATSGRIDLSMDAGTLDVDALSEDSSNALAGTIHQAPGQEVRSSYSMLDQKVVVSIHNDWHRTYIFHTDVDYLWDFSLTPSVPLDVDLSLGAGEITADLTRLQLTSVDVHIGAGSLVLRLPSKSDVDVTVNIGAGSAKIYLPEDADVRIDCTTGVGNCELPNGSGFWSQSYTSPDYSSSDYKITIRINVGVGEAQVR
jgi:hypothetical protein